MPRAKPGTKPKPTGIEIQERYASGNPKPTEAQKAEQKAVAPTIIRRLKDHLIPMAKDKRLGSVLGIMHLEGILSEAEAEAGLLYAEDVGAYERSHGHPARSARSAAWEGGFGRADLDLDALKRMDPDAADKIERKMKRHRKAVDRRYDRAQACVPTFPLIASAVLEELCCNDRPVSAVHHPGVKQILRNLAVHYGLQLLDGKRKAPTSKKVDASLLAQGAVDALEAWFAGRGGEVIVFRLAVAVRGVPPAIAAYGTDYAGMAIEHTIKLNRSGLMTEEINAQLLKAAEDKGWAEAKKVTKGEAA